MFRDARRNIRAVRPRLEVEEFVDSTTNASAVSHDATHALLLHATPAQLEHAYFDTIQVGAVQNYTKGDVIWYQNHPDILYCEHHRMLCERVQLYPKEQYSPQCTACLAALPSPEVLFLVAERHSAPTLPAACAAWKDINTNHAAWLVNERKKETIEMLRNVEEAKRWSQRERAAWLHYSRLAHELNGRLRAEQRAGRLAGQQSASEGELQMYAANASRRYAAMTGFIRDATGNWVNKLTCDVHSSEVGHRFMIRRPAKYLPCGICSVPETPDALTQSAVEYDRRDRSAMPQRIQSGQQLAAAAAHRARMQA
jgi:hypothetical protein